MSNVNSGEIEQWVAVPVTAYATAYQVSSMGRVRSVNRIAASDYFIRHIRGVVLKGRVRRDGYKTVNMSFHRDREQFYVHQLIASAFIPNVKNLPQVIHLNGDKLDNRVSNLEWATVSERNELSIESGRNKSKGADNAQFKGIVVATSTTTGEQITLCGKKAIRQAGFDASAVYGCIRGRAQSHRGHTFTRTLVENA